MVIYVTYHSQFLQYVVKLGGIIYPFVTRIIYTNTCIQVESCISKLSYFFTEYSWGVLEEEKRT